MDEARSIFYDLHGLPIDFEQATVLLHDYEARLVAETELITADDGHLWVATVHMVIDQGSLTEEHVPVLFATRVHGIDTRRDLVGMRQAYPTVKAALTGHLVVVADVMRGLGDDVVDVHHKIPDWFEMA